MERYTRFFEDAIPQQDINMNLLSTYLKKHPQSDEVEKTLVNLIKGGYALLYHGTTHEVDEFDKQTSRTELNSQYYGDGIFFTPDLKTAWKYAYAPRNDGFEEGIIDEIKHLNKEAGTFLHELYTMGEKAWQLPKYKNEDDSFSFDGFDPDFMRDIVEWIPGSKIVPDVRGDSFNLFGATSGFNTGWFIKKLKAFGVKKYLPYPRVYYTAYKTDSDKVIVSDKEVKSSKYDTVIFIGRDLVGGISEVQSLRRKVEPTTVKIDTDY